MNTKGYKKTSGFTLVEALIALTVFSVGFLAVASLIPVGVKLNQTSRDSSVAVNLAQAKVEEINSDTYDNLSTGTIEPKAKLSADPENYLYDFSRKTEVEYVDSSLAVIETDQGMKRVVVTIYWNGVKGEDNLILSSLKSKL